MPPVPRVCVIVQLSPGCSAYRSCACNIGNPCFCCLQPRTQQLLGHGWSAVLLAASNGRGCFHKLELATILPCLQTA